MLGWIETLSPTLQGVVIGSTLSIVGTTLGVFLTNGFNLWSLGKQQAHDRTQKSLERVATLRRTVYLEVAEALGAGLSLIARQGHLGVPDAELSEPYSKRQPAIAKVYLTAQGTTAAALAKYTAEFQAALVPLTLARNKAMALRQRITDIRARRDAQTEKANEMEEAQKQWFIQADGNESKHAAMGHAAEFHRSRAKSLAAQADELVKDLKQQHLDLFDAAQRENLRLVQVLFPFIVEVRKELESPVVAEEFSTIFQYAKPIPREQLQELLGISPS